MIYRDTCKVFRNTSVTGEYNRTSQVLLEIGEEKVNLSRKSLTVAEMNAQNKDIQRFRLFTRNDADIKLKDVLEINGAQYVVDSSPMRYRIHSEIDVTLKKEV